MSEIKVNIPVGLACAYDRNYKIPEHIELINNALMNVVSGKTKRLMINMPPRHGKSELISKYFPAWYLLNYPDKRIILTSYEADFASSWGRKVRDLINEYGAVFDAKLRNDSKAGHRFELKEGGQLNTAGVGGAITGKGADILIIDDPIKNIEEASSVTIRNKVWDWYVSTAYTRLEPDGAIILIMTRWHFDDLAGRILANDANNEWTVLSLPAIDDNNNALWPGRFDLQKLQTIKENIGSQFFSALYQQIPLSADNQIFKFSYWKFYRDLPKFITVFQSWDTAIKTKETNDFSVCLTIGVANDGLYILDLFRSKLEFPDLLKVVQFKASEYDVSSILIEDKSSGQGLIQTLRRETSLVIKDVQVSGDKVLRANLFAPLLEAGKVFLPDVNMFPDKSAWLNQFLSETEKFPLAPHDDIVDALTQTQNYYKSLTATIPKYNDVLETINKRYFNINNQGKRINGKSVF